MNKLIASLLLVAMLGTCSFAAMSGGYTRPDGNKTYVKYTAKAATESATIWDVSAIGERAYLRELVISASDASVLTITDAETTANTLAVIRIPADTTVVIPFDVQLIGSAPTTVAALASFKAAADVVTAINITAVGWED